METLERNKTYRMMIVVNEMKEFESSFRSISNYQIVSKAILLKSKIDCISTYEDVFIGAGANWSEIKERIEEYRHLSYIRKGKLEIVYCSDFRERTKAFISDTNYFHFYDTCIKREDILLELKAFQEEFETELSVISMSDLCVRTKTHASESKVLNMNLFDLESKPERILRMA
ncbi:MAG: hypothetical protein DWP98_13100 [Bacteroidetes bacterium]|nr:MAG: hypothetical protein DWP98_13100 [Bacteroidota bacterium]MBL1145753.1 hypothetical protein [Bacteroidota bacterium]MCB0803693.1 hypothetical protein [Flavobacteriales bacterium]NOG58547.1 hypothetical protein [Bacteroidota bacterium]